MPKLIYNAPVVLTFSLIASLVMLIDEQSIWPGVVAKYFTGTDSFDYTEFKDYWLSFSHVLGDSCWKDLFSNLTFILLLGPILEEKYGSGKLLVMILITAVVSTVVNVLFVSSDLLGASGIVLMFITLSSVTELKQKSVPITFLLVVTIFLGSEIASILNSSSISHLPQLIGGAAGTVFGFVMKH